jgi:hypothetical protein
VCFGCYWKWRRSVISHQPSLASMCHSSSQCHHVGPNIDPTTQVLLKKHSALDLNSLLLGQNQLERRDAPVRCLIAWVWLSSSITELRQTQQIRWPPPHTHTHNFYVKSGLHCVRRLPPFFATETHHHQLSKLLEGYTRRPSLLTNWEDFSAISQEWWVFVLQL